MNDDNEAQYWNYSIQYVKKIQDLEYKMENLQKYICMQLAKYQIKNHNHNLKDQIGEVQKVNQRLVDQMEAEKNSFISEENMMKFLVKSFIVEISKNLKVPKNRRRYSNEFYDFSMLLYTQSPKLYRILRQIYPFKSEYCLRKKYADIIFQISRSLVDFMYSIELEKSIQIKGECTLAIVAFCFKIFSGTSLSLSFKQHYTESTEESILLLENEEEEEEADDIADDEMIS